MSFARFLVALSLLLTSSLSLACSCKKETVEDVAHLEGFSLIKMQIRIPSITERVEDFFSSFFEFRGVFCSVHLHFSISVLKSLFIHWFRGMPMAAFGRLQSKRGLKRIDKKARPVLRQAGQIYKSAPCTLVQFHTVICYKVPVVTYTCTRS